ncbi:hypothetical protein [Candidatus Enterovibrio escicola]
MIKPSLDELNFRSDLSVSVDFIKNGRKIAGLAFNLNQSN